MSHKKNSTARKGKSQLKAQPAPLRATPRWPHNLSDEQFAELTAKLNVASFVKALAEIVAQRDDEAA